MRSERLGVGSLIPQSVAIAVTLFLTTSVPSHTAETPHTSPDTSGDTSPVVVELFTSQSCNACPPADAFLRELARRDDVLALSFHVDYWNHLNWRDRFSLKEATTRQRAYVRFLTGENVYTPQMVIHGREESVGHNREEIFEAIAFARTIPPLVRIDLDLAGDGLRLSLTRLDPTSPLEAEVWLIGYDPVHETVIRRGENTGRTLRHRNVVRVVRSLGVWDGRPYRGRVPADGLSLGGRRWAVLVQRPGPGEILATAVIHATRL